MAFNQNFNKAKHLNELLFLYYFVQRNGANLSVAIALAKSHSREFWCGERRGAVRFRFAWRSRRCRQSHWETIGGTMSPHVRMNNYMLIENVRRCKPLWEKSAQEKTELFVRERMWDEIAARMGSTSKYKVSECARRRKNAPRRRRVYDFLPASWRSNSELVHLENLRNALDCWLISSKYCFNLIICWEAYQLILICIIFYT